MQKIRRLALGRPEVRFIERGIVTSIEAYQDTEEQNRILISPNPAPTGATVSVSFIGQPPGALEAYDLSGRLILIDDETFGNVNSLGTSDLSPGIFLVRNSSGDGCQAAKLLLNRR